MSVNQLLVTDLDGPLFGSMRRDTSTVRSVLASFPKARLQPDEFQSQYKSSYFLADAQPDELAAIYKALTQARLDFEALYSGARFLDVLPQGVSKGSTARMLAKKLGVAISHVIACGDSGNDVTLFAQGFRQSIVRFNCGRKSWTIDQPPLSLA